MNKTIYEIYADPSHAWLKVNIKELIKLNIHMDISNYSYSRGKFAYLEEDCDLTLFMKAKKEKQGIDIRIKGHHTNKSSCIRNYDSYAYVKNLFNTFCLQPL